MPWRIGTNSSQRVKNWYVPIRHGFHTNISHVWEKYARSQISCSKCIFLTSIKYPPKLLHFAFDSNSPHAYHNFINVEGNSNVLLLELLRQELECLRWAESRENLSTVFSSRPASLCILARANFSANLRRAAIYLSIWGCFCIMCMHLKNIGFLSVLWGS